MRDSSPYTKIIRNTTSEICGTLKNIFKIKQTHLFKNLIKGHQNVVIIISENFYYLSIMWIFTDISFTKFQIYTTYIF